MRFKQYFKEGRNKGGRWSRDLTATIEKGTTPRNTSGFANSVEHYLDPLDPRSTKLKKKPDWVRRHSRLMQ